MHLLHEGDFCRIGKAETGRACHGTAKLYIRKLLRNGVKLLRNRFLDL